MGDLFGCGGCRVEARCARQGLPGESSNFCCGGLGGLASCVVCHRGVSQRIVAGPVFHRPPRLLGPLGRADYFEEGMFGLGDPAARCEGGGLVQE